MIADDVLMSALMALVFWIGSITGERFERKRWRDAAMNGGTVEFKEKRRVSFRFEVPKS